MRNQFRSTRLSSAEGRRRRTVWFWCPQREKLPVVSMSTEVDAFEKSHEGVNIGYVHGEEPVDAACADGKAVGLILPKLDKSRFLETLHDIGTLPRKAFSMGEAEEKRFYIEARSIRPSCGDVEQAAGASAGA